MRALDKLGPMTRGVEDALMVLAAISGPDAGDVDSVPSKLDYDGNAGVKGLRVGYFPAWMRKAPADVDRAALETVPKLGMVPVEVALPGWPDPRRPMPEFSPPRRVPHGVTLIGRLFDEGTLGRVGLALEQAFGVAAQRPPGF